MPRQSSSGCCQTGCPRCGALLASDCSARWKGRKLGEQPAFRVDLRKLKGDSAYIVVLVLAIQGFREGFCSGWIDV